jgi:mono/diheme cytochrome c family protein
MRHKYLIPFLSIVVFVVGCRFYFNTTTDSYSLHSSNITIQNGKNLAHNICAGCHFDPDSKKFIGKPMHDLPGIGGKVFSANLTQSNVYGVTTKYSEAELFYLLKTGIARNGKFMPYMMRPMMADEDINDVITFLRSNDPEVAATEKTTGNTHLNLLGKMFIRIAFKQPTPYSKNVARPDEGNAVEYGRYLVAVIGCYHCHSGSLLHVEYNFPENSKRYMQGGARLKGKDGKIRSVNLTPDNETGIGTFTLADFSKAVREGIAPGERQLRIPMPKFKALTDKQTEAIYSYLRSLPAEHHAAGKNL